ncbi:MAG: hypothetical protein ABSH32_08795 [Bryobacteraceae bacterium]
MPDSTQSSTALDRLQALSEEAGTNKGKLSPEGRHEAVSLLSSLWRDPSVPTPQILDAAERVRGGDIASSLASVWRELQEDRRQAIVNGMVDRPVEATGRNIYAAAAITEYNPDLSVELLMTARDNKETSERLHVAFFKRNPELLRALGTAHAAQYKMRNVFKLLLNCLSHNNYQAGSADDRAVIETFVAYVGANNLIHDSTFGDLLQCTRLRLAEWPPERRRGIELQLADGQSPSRSRDGTPAAPTSVTEPPANESAGHRVVTPPEVVPKGIADVATILAQLQDRAAAANEESTELKTQSERAAGLADLLYSIAEILRTDLSGTEALARARQQLEEKDGLLLATQQRLTRSEHAAEEFRQENLDLRKRLDASEATQAAQFQRASDLAHKCQELEAAADLQRRTGLEQMQKYAQTRLEEFRSGLARALYPSLHDLPATFADLPPDLVGVLSIRFEQVLRELERHEIVSRVRKEAPK